MATITLVSGILDAKRRVSDFTARLGRAQLNAQYPNDFEYYLCAFQLVDANDENNILEYFIFPVMPSQMSIHNTKLKSITKTAAGVVTLENNTFIPLDISISGNFGRKLRTLASAGSTVEQQLPLAVTNQQVSNILSKVGKGGVKVPEFSINVKSGYGCMKVLERIFDRASTVMNERPVMLYFYNFAFNAHYLVEPINISFSQEEGTSNMIWQYNLSMKAIAPANEIQSSDKYKDTLSKFVSQDLINRGVQSTLGFVKDQKTILSNQLRQKVGDSIQLEENLNRTPQIIKAITPFY